METREPGEKGSTQGQIQTPMCSENVGNKGEGKVHSYKKVTGGIGKTTGSKTSMEGPGVKGNWDTQIKITGNNQGKY